MHSAGKTFMFLLRSATLGLAIAFVVVFFYPGFTGMGMGGSSSRSFARAVRASSASVVNIHIARHMPAPRSNAAGPQQQRFAEPRSRNSGSSENAAPSDASAVAGSNPSNATSNKRFFINAPLLSDPVPASAH